MVNILRQNPRKDGKGYHPFIALLFGFSTFSVSDKLAISDKKRGGECLEFDCFNVQKVPRVSQIHLASL